MDVRRRQQSFSPQRLATLLRDLPAVERFWLAFSGGCDSHVLLHAAAQLRRDGMLPAVHAVHVDHGLQAASSEWARHCAAVCAELEIPLTLLRIDARAVAGESPEAAARHGRYRAIAEVMTAGDCLLTAHHQDDQAETLLLQLLRGGGPHGLAAMPALSAFAAGRHARPLLSFPREELRRYAQRHGLRWIDDPSNNDSGFDRNYLRNRVMPVLRERWPAVARVFSRGAAHQAEAAQLLDTLAEQDLQHCSADGRSLSIAALAALDGARQRNVLRYWLKGLGFKLPDAVRLDQVQRQLLHAAPDRTPEVAWQGVTVRRYRDQIHAMAPQIVIASDTVLSWDLTQSLSLPDGSSLIAVAAQGSGVRRASCREQGVTVRYRHGGESCQIAERGVTRPLKKLLQERGVPSWERERIPLIYVGERLAAVADIWVCAPCHATTNEEGLVFEWHRAAMESGG